MRIWSGAVFRQLLRESIRRTLSGDSDTWKRTPVPDAVQNPRALLPKNGLNVRIKISVSLTAALNPARIFIEKQRRA